MCWVILGRRRDNYFVIRKRFVYLGGIDVKIEKGEKIGIEVILRVRLRIVWNFLYVLLWYW